MTRIKQLLFLFYFCIYSIEYIFSHHPTLLVQREFRRKIGFDLKFTRALKVSQWQQSLAYMMFRKLYDSLQKDKELDHQHRTTLLIKTSALLAASPQERKSSFFLEQCLQEISLSENHPDISNLKEKAIFLLDNPLYKQSFIYKHDEQTIFANLLALISTLPISEENRLNYTIDIYAYLLSKHNNISFFDSVFSNQHDCATS